MMMDKYQFIFLFQLVLSAVKSATRAGRTCDVIFTNNLNRSSVWIVTHASSHLRLEFEGAEVKVNHLSFIHLSNISSIEK